MNGNMDSNIYDGIVQAENAENVKKGNGFRKFMAKSAGVVLGAGAFGIIAAGVFRYGTRDIWDKVEERNTEQTTEALPEDIELPFGMSEDIEKTGEEADNVDIGSTTVLSGNDGMDVSEIVTNVMPSVVSIHITAITELNQGIFGSYSYESEGSGSGIIIDKNDTELLIVTNNHVVQDAETVNVDLIDGETYEAKVKGTDSDNDLAIISVPLEDISDSSLAAIKIAQLGDSNELMVGEQVVAIGNALGYGQSVTTGIVSALNRENSTNKTPLIQTDAAINPGNSGGALLNMKGEVIGINSSKYASTTVEGIGYAIPVSSVMDIINDLKLKKTREKVDEEYRGYLGIECGTVTEEMQYYYKAPAGVYVTKVDLGMAAQRAGLPVDSIITKFDGTRVNSAVELTSLLEYYSVGEEIEVTYSIMEDNEYVEKTLTVKLGKRPSNK